MIGVNRLTAATVLTGLIAVFVIAHVDEESLDLDQVVQSPPDGLTHKGFEVEHIEPNHAEVGSRQTEFAAEEPSSPDQSELEIKEILAREAAELDQREREHGMPAGEQQQAFNDYPDESLVELVEQGDFEAAYELADRHVKAGHYDEAVQVLEVAAGFGSSFAFIKAARITAPLAPPDERQSETYKKQLYTSLGYLEAAVIRGNPYAGTIARAKLSIEGIELSPVELVQVHQLALENFSRVQQLRIDRDLGELTNITSGPVASLMRTQLALPASSGDNNVFLAEEAYMSALAKTD